MSYLSLTDILLVHCWWILGQKSILCKMFRFFWVLWGFEFKYIVDSCSANLGMAIFGLCFTKFLVMTSKHSCFELFLFYSLHAVTVLETDFPRRNFWCYCGLVTKFTVGCFKHIQCVMFVSYWSGLHWRAYDVTQLSLSETVIISELASRQAAYILTNIL